MIESIEIKNFRCFKDTKIAKFGLVNLFGGFNNSGKTTLLEAIFLAKDPYREVIFSLYKLRKESDFFVKAKPESAWDNFFYQQNKENSIQLNIIDEQIGNRSALLVCDDDFADLVSFTQNIDKEASEFFDGLSISKKSALHIYGKDNDMETFSSVLVASHTGIAGNSKQGTKINITCSLIFPGARAQFARDYEHVRFDGKADIVLRTLQIVDKTIEKIDVFNIGEPIMYLTKKDGVRTPLSLFGDAVSAVLTIVLAILKPANEINVLLIDEIENGIHYTVQEELWKMLFKLAVEFNVQIFSTSHSLEMIKAFAKVAQQFPEQAAYFEMARSPKTGLIKGIRHDVNTLTFELDRNMTIRGE